MPLFFLLVITGLLLGLGWSMPTRAEPLVVQLKWRHQFQFAGYYMAQAKGYYRAAGLEVELHANGEGGVMRSPGDDVVAGRAAFGVTNAGLIKRFANNQPVIALAAILQHSAVCWLTLDRPDIRSFGDLAGKRLRLLGPGSEESLSLLAPFDGEHIPRSRLTLIPADMGIQDLIDGKVDAIDAYTTNEPFLLAQRGIPYQLFMPRSYGIDFYGDVLFTSREMVDNHPEQVQAFLQASLRGWRYALDHVDETIAVIQQHYRPDLSREHLRFEADTMRDLMQPDLIAIGHMNPNRWRRIAELLLGNTHAEQLDLDNFLYQDQSARVQFQHYLQYLALSLLVSSVLVLLLVWYYRLNRRLANEITARRQAEAHLRALSETDPLTGLYNRRYLQQQLQLAWAASHHPPTSLALLMLDIDHFKQINDSCGHPNGDIVLQQLACRLRTGLRPDDTLARVGGEEFILLLPGCDLPTAYRRAEQLRQSVAELVVILPDDRPPLRLTVSIGVALACAPTGDAEQLLSQVDQALYQAKTLGRNRVECYGSQPHPV